MTADRPWFLIYDFETTGLPVYGSRSDHPDQPHIVQAGAVLCLDDEQGTIVDQFEAIAMPSGWVIPQAMTDIHGISTEHALEVGIPEPDLIGQFLAFSRRAVERVAHNEAFDARISRIALKRFMSEAVADEWRGAMPAHCTCAMAKETKLFRSHSLNAVHRGLFAADIEHAHKAMADTLACQAIFFELRRRRTERLLFAGLSPAPTPKLEAF